MKLITTKDYLLLINEEAEIKVKDKVWWEDPEDGLTSQLNTAIEVHEDLIFMSEANASEIEAFPHEVSLVIAYYPLKEEAKELDLPLLPPFEEIDVEKLVFDYTLPNGFNRTDAGVSIMKAFIAGYKAAQSKGQYSLEDMLDAFEYGLSKPEFQLTRKLKEDLTIFVKLLSTQQLPKEFIPEYEYKEIIEKVDELSDKIGVTPKVTKLYKTLKTITNSEGKQEIQGHYIW